MNRTQTPMLALIALGLGVAFLAVLTMLVIVPGTVQQTCLRHAAGLAQTQACYAAAAERGMLP
jgi:hypothetical protein